MRRAGIAAAVAVALTFAGAACGGGKGAAEKAVEKATNGKVKANDNGGVTVNANGNQVNLGGSQLPSDFPKSDVPTPSGATLVASASNTENGKKVWLLTYTVKGDTASVVSDYQKALTDAGYRVDNSTSAGGSGASYQAFTAVGTTYDVNVAGGAATGQDAGFVVTVQPHDTSNDTTTSSG
ncbi:MAG TPA: hypothetical protein VIB48_09645 [Acidimicrobiia bacterium]|jgi:hypothetical protein